MRSNPSWILLLPMLALLLILDSGLSAHADNPSSHAPLATVTTGPSAASAKRSPSANLGKINVTATRELIKTMQVVKVALNQPFTNSSDKADVVACRIISGHEHMDVQERMGAVLECGTNSWFTWQRETCNNGGLTACTMGGPRAAAYKRKGAWHSMRALNLQQLMALRELLKELPAPGKGDVVVVDKDGKAVLAIKASDGSSDPDKD